MTHTLKTSITEMFGIKYVPQKCHVHTYLTSERIANLQGLCFVLYWRGGEGWTEWRSSRLESPCRRAPSYLWFFAPLKSIHCSPTLVVPRPACLPLAYTAHTHTH